mmetsp:Transcript_19845/g.40327  ORF Transcript_19845/g.40327 Transcript_19845/m.40327 type:complete len:112 (+) Transcript_19845:959-1294(+)
MPPSDSPVGKKLLMVLPMQAWQRHSGTSSTSTHGRTTAMTVAIEAGQSKIFFMSSRIFRWKRTAGGWSFHCRDANLCNISDGSEDELGKKKAEAERAQKRAAWHEKYSSRS